MYFHEIFDVIEKCVHTKEKSGICKTCTIFCKKRTLVWPERWQFYQPPRFNKFEFVQYQYIISARMQSISICLNN